MLDILLATPRIRLAELPTPVQYCPRLTAYLEGRDHSISGANCCVS